MDGWAFDKEAEWDDREDRVRLYRWAEQLAHLFFLSDNDCLPHEEEDYRLGYLDADDWWPLVNQLDEMLELETLVGLADALESLLDLPGLPTELLEAPLEFLESTLEGNLPVEPSGRRMSSRRLVKIALAVTQLALELPDTTQAAVRAWADVQRNVVGPPDVDYDEDLMDLLLPSDLPPAVTGFSTMILLTLMRWPSRAKEIPFPPGFINPETYGEILAQWEALPDSLSTTDEGVGEAEALFAQGQLAHLLAQISSLEAPPPNELEGQDVALAYSRLSRAILWTHNQCRHCPERDGMACRAATHRPDQPVTLLDVASEMANTGRITGCIKTT